MKPKSLLQRRLNWALYGRKFSPHKVPLNPFRDSDAFVIFFLFCLCSKVAYIVNIMDTDQTAPTKGAVWSRFITVAFKIKSRLKCIWIYTADVISRRHFQDKNIGGLMVIVMTYIYWMSLNKCSKGTSTEPRIPEQYCYQLTAICTTTLNVC